MIDYTYIEGGLVSEPEIRFIPNGGAVCEFTLAQSDNKKNDAGGWETAQSSYIPVSMFDTDRNAWTEALKGLAKGTRLVVRGKFRTRSWEKDGKKRSRLEFLAVHAYVDAAVKSAPQGGDQPPQDVWGSSAPQGGFANNDDNPPF